MPTPDASHDPHIRWVPAGLCRLADVAANAVRCSRTGMDCYLATRINDPLTIVARSASGVPLNQCNGLDAGSGRIFSARKAHVGARTASTVIVLAVTGTEPSTRRLARRNGLLPRRVDLFAPMLPLMVIGAGWCNGTSRWPCLSGAD